MKHFFTLFLALVATTVLWAADFEVDGIAYNIINSQKRFVEVTSKSPKYSVSVIIPSSVTYNNVNFRVTSIGNFAFYQCTSLRSIIIPNSVTSIGIDAFAWCSSLSSISIGYGVTSIEKGAFSHCTSLTSITIPNSVISIGDIAFSLCTSLTSITIPDSVTSIGDGAFGLCSSLSSVTIGLSVTSIGEFAFDECSNDIVIHVPSKSLSRFQSMPALAGLNVVGVSKSFVY